jgi:hypothetical protein
VTTGVRRQAKYVGTTPTPKGDRSFRGYPEEVRALASEAYHLWRELAADIANPYSDHTSGLLAGRMAVDASKWEDGLVILDSIRVHMNPKSSPRRIPEWARLHGADQRGKQHDRRILEERAAAQQIVDHQGTLYLGHVPDVVGSACVKCGGDLKAHLLARRPALRHIGTLLPGLPAVSEEGDKTENLYNKRSATGGGTDA